MVFAAMCGFVHPKNNDPATVYLPTEGGAHSAALATLATNVKFDETTWLPKFFAYVEFDGVIDQVALWPLVSERVTVPGANGVTWKNRHLAIDLAEKKHHDKAKAKGEAEIVRIDPAINILTIQHGTLDHEELTKGTTKRKGGSEIDKNRDYAKRILWQGAALTLENTARQRIVLNDGSLMSVSNLAPVPHPEGMTHFKEYYRFIDLNGEQEIEVSDKDEDVYDCVPPSAWP
jgi:hypothetical protein